MPPHFHRGLLVLLCQLHEFTWMLEQLDDLEEELNEQVAA
jgi:hypothetical protein